MKKDVRSLSLKDLCSFFESNNYPSFRGKQVYIGFGKNPAFHLMK